MKLFPPIVTAIIQLMVQAVIVTMLGCYQADLRTLANEDDSIIASWKKMMMLAVVYCISQAWSSVNPVTLVWL
jgi:L-cystine uptake protein TcyP (sodium:dicarboxylate symporter family)